MCVCVLCETAYIAKWICHWIGNQQVNGRPLDYWLLYLSRYRLSHCIAIVKGYKALILGGGAVVFFCKKCIPGCLNEEY